MHEDPSSYVAEVSVAGTANNDRIEGNDRSTGRQELLVPAHARLPSASLEDDDHDDILETAVAEAAAAAAEAAAAEETEGEDEGAAPPGGNGGPAAADNPASPWIDPQHNPKKRKVEDAMTLPEDGQLHHDDNYHPNDVRHDHDDHDHHDDDQPVEEAVGEDEMVDEHDDDEHHFDESYHDDDGDHDHHGGSDTQADSPSSRDHRSHGHHGEHDGDRKENSGAPPEGGQAPPPAGAAPRASRPLARSAPARVSWQDRIEQLKAYKAEHGDLLIPIRYKLNPSLGKFVHNTREQFKLFHKRTKANYKKKCSLTHERLAQLDQIGFAWTTERARKHQEDWNGRFDQLVAYKAEHGDCLVPHGYPEDRSFAEWIHRQRTTYAHHIKEGRTNQVTEERVKKLEEIGFNFRVHVDRWTEHYEQLQEYRKQHGHCMVPTQFPENAKLGRWVHTQRFQHRLMLKGRKSSMTDERVKLLEDLGFTWEGRPAHGRASWHQRFSELKAYRAAMGHLRVSPVEDPRLYSWCSEQLQRLVAYDEQLQPSLDNPAAATSQPKVKGMTPDRALALAGIGFTKDLELAPVVCEAGAAAVAAARELEGHSSHDEDDDHHDHTYLEEEDEEDMDPPSHEVNPPIEDRAVKECDATLKPVESRKDEHVAV